MRRVAGRLSMPHSVNAGTDKRDGQKIMEDPGFTEDLRDYRPPLNLPQSANLPRKFRPRGADGAREPLRLFSISEPSMSTPRRRPAEVMSKDSLRVMEPDPLPFPIKKELLFHPKTKTRATPASRIVSSTIALGN